MSGAGGWGVRKGNMQADIARHTGRHLLTRQPQTLVTKVSLNDVVVSNLKQKLPVFRAIELTPLNERFTKTAFEERTIDLSLEMFEEDLATVCLADECKSVPHWYKRREQMMSIEALTNLLKNISGIIRTLGVNANDSLHKALLEAEELSPIRLFMCNLNSHKEYLVPLVKRFAGTGKVHVASYWYHLDDVDWQQAEQCLTQFTSLQRLYLEMSISPPASDWLRNAIMGNSQLKQLKVDAPLFFSPVMSDAISVIGNIGGIHIGHCYIEQLIDHVEMDLCGVGQCDLTKLVLALTETGRLKLEITGFHHRFGFYGDHLRLCYYLLSLYKIGKTVVVKAKDFPGGRMQEFVEDLSHYFSPLTKTSIGVGGTSYHYRVRVDRVTIFLYESDHQSLDFL